MITARLFRIAILGLTAITLGRPARAQAPGIPKSLAQSIVDAAVDYGRRLTTPDAEVVVHDSSFIVELSPVDVRQAVSRGRGAVRAAGGAPLFVCGTEPHSCHLTTSGAAIRLVKLQRQGDTASADVVVSRTVARPHRSDVMYTMVRFGLRRSHGAWECVSSEVLFTT